VGHITSGAWGYRVGASLGLATLHHEAGVTKDWLAGGGFDVLVAGNRHAVTLQFAPFYDPAGTRMKA
jgi:glycine cleavage system aminomethyltransferase T